MTTKEITAKLRDMAAQILTPSSKAKKELNEMADYVESIERVVGERARLQQALKETLDCMECLRTFYKDRPIWKTAGGDAQIQNLSALLEKYENQKFAWTGEDFKKNWENPDNATL